MRRLRQIIKQFTRRHKSFGRFLAVGGFNSVFDVALFFILTEGILLEPVAANLISTSLTMCVSFFLNHRFVFGSDAKKSETAFKFIMATLFNVWIVQSLAIAAVIRSVQDLAVASQHTWLVTIAAKIFGISISFVLNFAMYRKIFRARGKERMPRLVTDEI